MAGERPVADVATPVKGLLVVALIAQIALHASQPAPVPRIDRLPSPPPANTIAALSLGETRVAAKLAMLWLQAFDYAPGISVPLASLDYARVVAWLETILALDPGASYPLLAAARIYAEVPDPARQRQMLDFVEAAFHADPNARWQWLAHAVFVARHRLHDDALALEYARALARETDPARVPSWARQMHIFVLENIGELEAAKVLLGGLLASGEVTDPHEHAFLSRRLQAIEERLAGDAR